MAFCSLSEAGEYIEARVRFVYIRILFVKIENVVKLTVFILF